MTRPAQENLRNVAIIAHVDHGKTTLVDAMLSQSGIVELDASGNVADCVMDSNPLERERGITILAKNCAVTYTIRRGPRAGEVYRVNIIDTPGHADFGGEVERVLRMADGCLLLVDAMDGPMPQTRFVLQKALELGLKPIVVVNKCDRPEARPDGVVNEVFDLLVDLGAHDEALDFPVIYASGKNGWAGRHHDPQPTDVDELFDTIVDRVPPPSGDPEAPLQMLVTSLDYSEYTGRIAIGRVFNGRIRASQPIAITKADGSVERSRALVLRKFEGLGRLETKEVLAGDLCAVEGVPGVDIGDTICSIDAVKPMERVHVDEPTLHMVFRVNDSPGGGKEGRFVTSRQIAERLDLELESNVALRVESGASAEEFRVSGRGLLHLGVLLETMRREGYELTVGRPEVIEREIDGVKMEPIERLSVDTAAEGMGGAMELLGQRGAEVKKMEARGGRMHIEAEIPARGLIGLRAKMLNATAGEAIMHHTFKAWEPLRSKAVARNNGVMISNENGTATQYSIEGLADRGVMFIKPGDKVYTGMIVGEHNRDNDLGVNIVRAKQMTNFREANKEQTVVLKAPRLMSLEAALEYLEEDEYVEITPSSIRLRKKILDETERKRQARRERDRAEAMESAAG